MKSSPKIVERAVADGHQIVNHTYTHSVRSLFKRRRLQSEIKDFDRLLAEIPNSTAPLYFRPPMGVITPPVFLSVAKNRLQYAHLTFFVNDSATTPDTAEGLLARVKEKIEKHRGGAIVFHEMRFEARKDPYAVDKSWLPGAIDELIGWAKARGYSFVVYPSQPKS